MKRFLPILFTLVILFACEKKEDPVATAINLDKTELTLKVGEKYNFKVAHTPSEAKAPEYTWTVEKIYLTSSGGPVIIAEIDKNGVLTATQAGTTKMIVSTTTLKDATGDPLKSRCVIKIEPIKAEGIKLSKNKTTIKAGGEETLTYTVTPETTTNKDVIWASSDLKIATVSNGLIKAVGAGTATISVTVKNTSIKDICEVIVDPSKVEGLTLNESEKTIMQGESFKLTPVFTPEFATNKGVKWTSSNEKIALIDNLGNVTTNNYGNCVIKAVSEDGGFEATCKLEVTPIPVESIYFDDQNYSVEIGGRKQLTVIVFPENAGNKKIKWSSSNPTFASIDENGIVKGNSIGSVIITAISENGGYEAKCELTVASIPLSHIQMDKYLYHIEIGSKISIPIQYIPENTTNKKVVWYSSNPNSVSVDQNGNVEGLYLGSSDIKIIADDNGYTTACTVNVFDFSQFIKEIFPSSSLSINGAHLTGVLYVGLKNNSSKIIDIKSLSITDTNTFNEVENIIESNSFGILKPGEDMSIKCTLNNIYDPMFIFKYDCEGKEYNKISKYRGNKQVANIN